MRMKTLRKKGKKKAIRESSISKIDDKDDHKINDVLHAANDDFVQKLLLTKQKL